MAGPNEEVVRQANDALSAGDIERFLSFHADDAVIHIPGRSPFAGEHRGREAFERLARAQLSVPGTSEVHDILSSDEHVVLLASLRTEVGGPRVPVNS